MINHDSVLELVIEDSICDWCLTDEHGFDLLDSYFEALEKQNDIESIENQILEHVYPFIERSASIYEMEYLFEGNKFREGYESVKGGLKSMGAGAKEFASKSYDTAKTFGKAFKSNWDSTRQGPSLRDRAKVFLSEKLPVYAKNAYDKAQTFSKQTVDRLGKAYTAGLAATKQKIEKSKEEVKPAKASDYVTAGV